MLYDCVFVISAYMRPNFAQIVLPRPRLEHFTRNEHPGFWTSYHYPTSGHTDARNRPSERSDLPVIPSHPVPPAVLRPPLNSFHRLVGSSPMAQSLSVSAHLIPIRYPSVTTCTDHPGPNLVFFLHPVIPVNPVLTPSLIHPYLDPRRPSHHQLPDLCINASPSHARGLLYDYVIVVSICMRSAELTSSCNDSYINEHFGFTRCWWDSCVLISSHLVSSHPVPRPLIHSWLRYLS
ncbi:hypothetical protein BDN70DRAFT_701649 [Pholiota conissans]|uniref:Uncharacterized protein n=1 Tax=Pholiota conissans TaxID=109636 RepID=A0A9P6CTD2_9AGAR|nr:hypothetical protein BDN70DRAFT_701649 [Pholiota conissans]